MEIVDRRRGSLDTRYGHDHILSSGGGARVAHWCRLRRHWKWLFPNHLSRQGIDGAESAICDTRHEYETPLGDKGTARKGEPQVPEASASAPDDLAGGEIHHSNLTKGRSQAGDAGRRKEHVHPCGIRSAALRTANAVAARKTTVLGSWTVFFSRDHVNGKRQLQVVHDHELPFLVDSDTTPVHAARRSRIKHGASDCRRGHRAFPAQPLEGDPASHLVERRDTEHVPFADHGIGKRRHARRERLGRARPFAIQIRLGYGSFRHLENGCAGCPVQDEDLPSLGRHDDRLAKGAVYRQVDEGRLRRHVVIPDVVVHGLEVPSRQPRPGVDCDDGACKPVHDFGSVPTVVVRCGVARRNVHQAEVVIGGRQAPDVRRAAGVMLTVRWNVSLPFATDVPCPEQGARPRIVTTDHSRNVFGLLIVQDQAADDHGSARHGRW